MMNLIRQYLGFVFQLTILQKAYDVIVEMGLPCCQHAYS